MFTGLRGGLSASAGEWIATVRAGLGAGGDLLLAVGASGQRHYVGQSRVFSMADVWHGTKKCAVNGAKIPRDSQTVGTQCPFCGNPLGANFDGTVEPGFDGPPGGGGTPSSGAGKSLATVGVFLGVNVVVIIGLSFVMPGADAGALRGGLGLLLGGLAAWWYWRSR